MFRLIAYGFLQERVGKALHFKHFPQRFRWKRVIIEFYTRRRGIMWGRALGRGIELGKFYTAQLQGIFKEENLHPRKKRLLFEYP